MGLVGGMAGWWRGRRRTRPWQMGVVVDSWLVLQSTGLESMAGGLRMAVVRACWVLGWGVFFRSLATLAVTRPRSGVLSWSLGAEVFFMGGMEVAGVGWVARKVRGSDW